MPRVFASSFCGECRGDVGDRDKAIKCEGFCEKWYHADCVNISKRDYGHLQKAGASVFWFCEVCKQKVKNFIETGEKSRLATGSENFFSDLSNKLDEVAVSVSKIMEERKEVHSPPMIIETKSYASIAKSAVILQPKHKQAAEDTEKELKNKINPTGLKISKVKKLKSGAVIVKCDDEQSRNKLLEDATKEMKDNYDVQENENMLPRVKISNISEDYQEQSLIEVLKKQNKSLKDAKAKVCTIWKNKKFSSEERFTAIIELDVKSFNEVVNDGVVYVGWDRCKVSESIHVKRCYNCLSFEHKSDQCKEQKVCSKCGESHSQDDQFGKNCKELRERCVNCIKVNKERNLNLDINHSAFDRECGVYQRKLKMIRNRIWN